MAYEAVRVAAGAKFLDQHNPGWWKRADPLTLDMANGSSCVLGQTYGDYDNGTQELGLVDFRDNIVSWENELSADDLGFIRGDDHDYNEYEKLEHFWEIEINNRKERAVRRTRSQ